MNIIEDEVILQKHLFKNDSEEDNYIYLNINILRSFKHFILNKILSNVEKSCINEYNLENYLIELTYDYKLESVRDGKLDNLIKIICNYIRGKPEFWIVNSEIYLKIINKYENFETKQNKDLIAIYNYLNIDLIKVANRSYTLNQYCKASQKDNDKINPDYHIQLFIEQNDFSTDILNDYNFICFYNLLRNENYFIDLDERNVNFYEIILTKHIYNYLLDNYKIDTNLKEINNSIDSNELKLRIQNFIIFFTYVNKNDEINNILNINKDETLKVLSQSKKIRLRDSAYKNKNIDDLEFELIMKLIKIREIIDEIKNKEEVKNFLMYLKENKISTNICSSENNSQNSENKMKITLYSYNI